MARKASEAAEAATPALAVVAKGTSKATAVAASVNHSILSAHLLQRPVGTPVL